MIATHLITDGFLEYLNTLTLKELSQRADDLLYCKDNYVDVLSYDELKELELKIDLIGLIYEKKIINNLTGHSCNQTEDL